MALANEIQDLRDRVLAELNAAHDYYVDTQTAWNFVQQGIAGGRVFLTHNQVTGTMTTHVELSIKASNYVKDQLTEATFQQFLSIFESYFFDLLRLWLLAYPRSLAGKQVDFRAILDAPDKDAITVLVVNKELNEVLYNRPTGWFTYLEERLNIGCPTTDEINRIGEAKATRDVLIHNRGVANRTYLSKAGTLARYQEGQRLKIPEDYHRQTWELLRKVISDISDATIVKTA
jgi:hypothetical protein